MTNFLTPERIVARLNRLPYPPTVYSHGWIYGVWYCGTAWKKAIYYGQFPSTFVRRIRTAFPTTMLHLCCGRQHIEGAINVDLNHLPEVDVVSNAESLPFNSGCFDSILIDPPYSEEDAQRYKVKRLLRAKTVLIEAHRVLSRDGWLIWLDERYPSYRRSDWRLRGLVCIVTGFERRTRILSMFQKTSSNVPSP